MVKFQIMSDTHEEFFSYPRASKYISDRADAIILAGDYSPHNQDIEHLRTLGKPVFYVLGNHEYYRHDFNTRVDEIKHMLKDSNVKVLERDVVEFMGITIIGCTMWTDMFYPYYNMTHSRQPDQGFNIRGMMADMHVIKNFNIEVWKEQFNINRKFLEEKLAEYANNKTIVITHHAPSFRSSHEKYLTSDISAGFCVNLDNLVVNSGPDIWVHGHCHEPFDYMLGETRVICNPGAYPGENMEFNKDFIVEL